MDIKKASVMGSLYLICHLKRLNFDAKLWGKSQCCIILDKDGLRWM